MFVIVIMCVVIGVLIQKVSGLKKITTFASVPVKFLKGLHLESFIYLLPIFFDRRRVMESGIMDGICSV